MVYLLCFVLIPNIVLDFDPGDLTIDEIIAQHKEAIGYSALAEIKVLTLIGKRDVCFKEYDTCYTNNYYKEIRKRPELYFNESELFGRTRYGGFDGRYHWSPDKLYVDRDFFDLNRYKANLDGLVYLYDKGWIRESKIITGDTNEIELDIYTEQNQQIYVRLNPKTYLITSILFVNFDESDKKFTNEYFFSKYIRKEKVKIPCKEVYYYQGNLFSTTTYNKVLFNQEIEDDVFKRETYVK